MGLGGLGGWSLQRLTGEASQGIAALAREATDSYQVYAPDHLRPVEIRANDQAELLDWVSQRLRRPVAVPDLSKSGYRFMGGRLVATAHGPAVLFMYDDDRGTRLVMLSRTMTVDRSAPMTRQQTAEVAGFAWAEDGIGYSLVGPVPPSALQPIAEQVRRQVGRQS